MEITKESKDNGDNQEKKEGKETSIYQRFKMNSHKIMIDVPNEGAFTDNKKNHKLEILKKRLGRKYYFNEFISLQIVMKLDEANKMYFDPIENIILYCTFDWNSLYSLDK